MWLENITDILCVLIIDVLKHLVWKINVVKTKYGLNVISDQ